MACNCGKRALQRQTHHASTAYPDGAGSYPLAGYPGCTTLHGNGVHSGTSVYVVARGTDAERLFPRSQLGEAAGYAQTLRDASLENVPTSGLCDAAVMDLFASVE